MVLVLMGFCIGAAGTLLGVGGGIVLVPILLHLYPEAPAHWIGGISMGMVALNATSGSVSYHFKRTIHYRAALLFTVAGIPGGILGVLLESRVERAVFERIFGVAMIVMAAALLRRPKNASKVMAPRSELGTSTVLLGCAISFAIGVCASFLGIGGGVFHVPLMSQVLGFPVHLATGTSHLILGITAWIAAITHVIQGDLSWRDPVLWQVGLGAVAGAQLGAHLSPRVSARVILRVLALALAAVGLRLLFR